MKNWEKPKTPIIELSRDVRNSMATHYTLNDLDPHYVVLGFLKHNGFFVRLYISVHKQEAKRRNLVKYSKFETN